MYCYVNEIFFVAALVLWDVIAHIAEKNRSTKKKIINIIHINIFS